MAKITGALMSPEASGKYGKCIVYSTWKGRQYARLLTKPSNPKSNNQAEVRTYFGSTGLNNKKIEEASDLREQIEEVTPSTQSWTSYFAKMQIGSASASIKAAITAYSELSTVDQGLWQTAAAGIPLNGYDIGYGEIEPITGAEQLFISATAAFALGLDIAPSNPSDWEESTINAFAAAYSA